MVRLVLEQGYTARNAEEASAAMQAVLGVGTATVESQGSLRYKQWSLVDDGISVTRVESDGAVVRMDAAPAPDMVVVAVLAGRLVLQDGDEAVELNVGDLGLVPLEHAVRASWGQVTMDLYSFPRSSLSHLLSTDTDRVALHAERLRAVSPSITRLWTRTAALLSEDVLRSPELADSDVIREQAIDALLGLTIEAFGIVDADEDQTGDQDTVDRATAYMRSNLARTISVTDVARSVGVSIRGLQVAFRRTGRGTPLAHLRALRMAAARHALTSSTMPLTAAEVARKVGYSNLGRFDAHYFDAFDALPEDDLAAAPEFAAEPRPALRR